MKNILFLSGQMSVVNNFSEVIYTGIDSEIEITDSICNAQYLIENNRYDLIITEVIMPSMGIFSLEETKNDLLTGITWFENVVRFLDVPILFLDRNNRYLKKIEDLKIKYPKNIIDSLFQRLKEDRLLNIIRDIFDNK